MRRWKYMGDMNLQYGGTFYDFSTWKDGYVGTTYAGKLGGAWLLVAP